MSTTFYDTYKDAGQSPTLVALHGGRWLISLLGFALNLVLVVATVKSKNLRNRCNILIGAEASANLLYQLSPSIPFFLALAGTNFIPLDRCLLYQLASLFGVHMSLLCALLIGLDRLLSIKFPIWVNKHKDRRYMGVLVGASVCYAALFIVYCEHLCGVYSNRQQLVMCTITLDCYQGLEPEIRCLVSAVFLNACTILVYGLLWASVRQNSQHVGAAKNAQIYTRRIMKSLLLITCITIFGWTASTATRLTVTFLPLSQVHSVFFINAIGYLTNLTSASSAPVLYFCSEEYRKAFQQLFHLGGGSVSVGAAAQADNRQTIRSSSVQLATIY